jgi:hypothetical protein
MKDAFKLSHEYGIAFSFSDAKKKLPMKNRCFMDAEAVCLLAAATLQLLKPATAKHTAPIKGTIQLHTFHIRK